MNQIQMLKKTQTLTETIRSEIAKVIVGQNDIIKKLLIVLYSGGHSLIVGVPGLAKTLMIKTLSDVMDMRFKRIQFTPDLMPSDITGTEVIEEDMGTGKRSFRYIKGPIFGNIILADEINRTPPKTQSALLEAMQEYHVTSAGQVYTLEKPFLVLATQNPIEQEGTYPLPEAQLDRFMFELVIDYPSEQEEKMILEKTTYKSNIDLNKCVTHEEILDIQKFIKDIPVSDHIMDYVVDLVRNTRPQDSKLEKIKQYVKWGAGPRAGQFLILGAKAKAAMEGKATVDISDINYIATDVLRHRILLNFNAEADNISIESIIEDLTSYK